MVCRRKTYHISSLAASLFILISFFANAQNKNEKTDTLSKVIIREKLDSIPLDTVSAQQEEVTNHDQTNYFLEKQPMIDLVKLRQLPDSVMKKMLAENDFWYANANVKRRRTRNNEWILTTKTDTSGKYNAVVTSETQPLVFREWFRVLVWLIIIGGFIAFLIVYLSNSETALFRRRNKSINDKSEEVETEDIFAINYSKEIDKAIRNAEYRVATRLMFLRLLKQLSEKKIIEYRQDRTNLDYLMQLNQTSYYKDFFRITRNYEYSWYGLFEIKPEAFAVIKNDFESFAQKLKQA
jgi:hypothetical protein